MEAALSSKILVAYHITTRYHNQKDHGLKRLRMSENRVLRRIFGPIREQGGQDEWGMSHALERIEMHTKFWLGNLKIRGHLGDLGIDEGICLECI